MYNFFSSISIYNQIIPVNLLLDVSEIPAKTRGAHFNAERLLCYPEPFVSLFEVGMIIDKPKSKSQVQAKPSPKSNKDGKNGGYQVRNILNIYSDYQV